MGAWTFFPHNLSKQQFQRESWVGFTQVMYIFSRCLATCVLFFFFLQPVEILKDIEGANLLILLRKSTLPPQKQNTGKQQSSY